MPHIGTPSRRRRATTALLLVNILEQGERFNANRVHAGATIAVALHGHDGLDCRQCAAVGVTGPAVARRRRSSRMAVASLSLQNLARHYGKVRAVDDLSVEVPEGAFVTLLGPSGCGKSTTLNLIAGLDKPDAGTILLG